MKKNIYIIIVAIIFSALLWVSISLSNIYIATIQLPVRITNFPDGYSTATRLPEKIDVKVRGQGWKLVYLNINTDTEYRISSGRERGRRFVNLYNYVLENQWLTSGVDVISIYPDTLSYFVEKVGEKKLKVIPETDLSFRSGYGLAKTVSVYPDSLTVYAPVSVLRNLNEIKTEELRITNLDNRTTKQVSLKEFPGAVFPENTVSITLEVQKILEKNVENIPVIVKDVPGDRDVVLLPGKLTAGIRGGIDIIAKVKQEDFTAYVNYRDVVLDTIGSIAPKLGIPENTQLIYVKPERLRYVIKKYK